MKMDFGDEWNRELAAFLRSGRRAALISRVVLWACAGLMVVWTGFVIWWYCS